MPTTCCKARIWRRPAARSRRSTCQHARRAHRRCRQYHDLPRRAAHRAEGHLRVVPGRRCRDRRHEGRRDRLHRAVAGVAYRPGVENPGLAHSRRRLSNSSTAVAVPKGKPDALAYVNQFVEEAKASGLVRKKPRRHEPAKFPGGAYRDEAVAQCRLTPASPAWSPPARRAPRCTLIWHDSREFGRTS